MCNQFNTSSMNYTVRDSTREDCRDIMRLIADLSEYEKMPDEVKLTHKGHTIVGYGFYYFTYCTWKGRVVYMEDLYVMPEFRGKGIGKALMSRIAQIGRARGCVRMQFTVLDWNKPSLDFYCGQGALNLTAAEGWQLMRFEGEAFEKLAQATN
ncbi:thialysine N-epsilon-acetyltransferase-like isoform X2 [Polyodon spathula]|uniref:thialysine N-epsilon-acetyltransferase-like isoform X2 n=1 Tax=Polyodon spathula TaxID=7913 RepID=UPI001B7F19DB|nr:thialysine N-epsilon-acetyltransferase-like isoform X2 [Polyodon spathula]